MANEDPDGTAIASVLSQEGVSAAYSGATLPTEHGGILVEGVAGTGECFMIGGARPAQLPPKVIEDVRDVQRSVESHVGRARLEWAHDGAHVWVLQLHRSPERLGGGGVVFSGTPTHEHFFDVDRGLEELRRVIGKIQGTNDGIVLVGDIGITSHFGDILRRAEIPSRLERRSDEATS